MAKQKTLIEGFWDRARWGVKGTCGNYRGPGNYDVSQTSYCQEWHERGIT